MRKLSATAPTSPYEWHKSLSEKSANSIARALSAIAEMEISRPRAPEDVSAVLVAVTRPMKAAAYKKVISVLCPNARYIEVETPDDLADLLNTFASNPTPDLALVEMKLLPSEGWQSAAHLRAKLGDAGIVVEACNGHILTALELSIRGGINSCFNACHGEQRLREAVQVALLGGTYNSYGRE